MPVVNYDWDELEDNIVEEYDDAGATIADYTTEPDHFGNVISQHRSGDSRFFHYDGQGSTLAVTDDDQNVTDTRAYSAFGETMESTGSTNFPLQYVGEKGNSRNGSTSDYVMRAVVYEPTFGRWLSLPIRFAALPSSIPEQVYYIDVPSYANHIPTVLQAVVSAVNPSALPIVTTFERPIGTGNVDPSTYKCGQIRARVLFAIKKAPCHGYLIQHITVKVHIQGCDPHSKCPGKIADEDTQFDYYEMFPFRPGGIGAWPRDSNVEAVDTRQNNGGFKQIAETRQLNCGKVWIFGVVRFYCAADILAKDDPDRWPPGGGGPSGNLPSKKERPPFWADVPAAEGVAGVGHSWCCCKEPLIHSERLNTQETSERYEPIPHKHD